MHTYRVWFDDGSTTLVIAPTFQEALRIAEANYPGSHPYKADQLD